MNILIGIDWYYPAEKSGGPAVSINNLCSLLCDKHDFWIVTSDHEFGDNVRYESIQDGWNNRDNAKVQYLSDSQICYSHLFNIVKELNPDCVMLNSIFGYKFTVPMLKVCGKLKVPILLAPRGELCKNAFDKKYKKIPYLFALKKYLRSEKVFYLSTSDEEHSCIINRIGLKASTRIIDIENVPTIPKHIDRINTKQKGILNCVFISRIQSKKNLLYALKIISKLGGNINYDIYGPIEEQDYWNQCQEVIKVMPSNVRVSYKGILLKDEVHLALSKYDLMFFPTLSENYGHVIIEALLSQCPVLISDQTPWNELHINNAGAEIPLGNDNEFINVLNEYLSMGTEEYQVCIDGCKSYTDKKLNITKLKDGYDSAFSMIGSNR
jgi:glycosyltransferase involved in cell wall biosynthesis